MYTYTKGVPFVYVMEAIRKMEPAWKKIAASIFRLGTYKDANGQLRPCYQQALFQGGT